MATLLPPAEITFIDANGKPLVGGSVYMFVPSTTTPKDSWKDAAQTVLNSSPIILDGAGRAIIYGSGIYRQVVYDADGDLQWDQLTADTSSSGTSWGGTSTGVANAQVIAAGSFTAQDGDQVSFLAGVGLTNTGPMTISLGGSAIALLRDTPTGPAAMAGGEVVAGNAVTGIYDQARGAFHMVQNNFIMPSGAVMAFAMQTAPAGWLLCDGTSYLRTAYPALFTAIGTTFGSADGTHFNVPNLLGRFVRGWDSGGSIDPARVFGSTQASANLAHIHTFAGDLMPAHLHTVTVFTISGAGSVPLQGAGSPNGTENTSSNSAGTPTGTIASTGGSESRPTNVALNYCVKF